MKTLIENLCGKLEDWGIDPITLAKAIGIFVIFAVLIMSMVIYPAIFVTLLIVVICIAMIGLIYSMIE